MLKVAMHFQLLPVFLAAVAIWSQVATAAVLSRNITFFEESELLPGAAHIFLSCLNASDVTYRLYVEDGAIIVFPSDKRMCDFDGIDEWLEQCMMITSSTVVAMVQDSIKPSYGYLNSIPAIEATYAWLLEKGARGLHTTGKRPIFIDSPLIDWIEDGTEEYMGEEELCDLC
ncbi:uncharacterized protein N7503_003510 [Penicillium pulvis]|uniref:uncharacterized protein n=1 Tax=Penicillium pulvis TaxID=1562058 RepID=UPI0025477ED6|nr:uncharacterized protein N7503_003510 [Penicillium pulvis]KAJ5805908.1 hypothetical protein N7503_003510 [Penicillium pulvis]